jgi:hypothetical protein
VIKKEEIARILNDPDYIHSPKHGNSIKRFLDHYPDGAPDGVICKALCISQQELEDIYKSAIIKLREDMNSNAR